MSHSKGTALITGASSGIGAVYADRLARRGYDLILVARSMDKLSDVAKQIHNATGQNAESFRADLSVATDIDRVADRLASDHSISVVVNNAGLGAVGPVLTSDVAAIDQVIQLNVIAFTRILIAAAVAFAKQHSGLIINIGSIVSLAPELSNGVYSATKAYVQNLSFALHKELVETGVKVQLVMPGATATPIWEKSGLPVSQLPQEIVMSADNVVDAALAGLDKGEFVTIPSLPDIADFEAFEKVRLSLAPNLSRSVPASRYGLGVNR